MATTANYTIEGLDEALKAVQGLQSDLRTMANRELRAASKEIAADAARQLPGMASGAAQSVPVASTARPKSDRIPVVKIPGKKVPISGIRRSRGLNASRQVAFGATGGGVAKQFGGTRNWIHANRMRLLQLGMVRYQAALRATLSRYGLI